jgi:hypothetical protein
MDNVVIELIQALREQQNTLNRIVDTYSRVLDIRQGQTYTEVHRINLPRSSIAPFLTILQTLSTGTPSASTGLTSEQIESRISNIDISTNDNCAICQCGINDNTELYGFPRRINICGHIFHRNCIHRSLELNNNCPLCRTAVVDSSNNIQEPIQEPLEQEADSDNSEDSEDYSQVD